MVWRARADLDLHTESERGNQSHGQDHSFHASFTPTIHRMEPSTHMCEGVMVCRKGEGGFEGVIGWLRVRACSRRGLMVWLCDGLCEMLPLLLCILSESTVESSSRVWRGYARLDLQSERDR